MLYLLLFFIWEIIISMKILLFFCSMNIKKEGCMIWWDIDVFKVINMLMCRRLVDGFFLRLISLWDCIRVKVLYF